MPTIDEIAYVYDALPTASVILKADAPLFTIVTANTAFLKSTGTILSALVGKGFFEAFPMNPDDPGIRTKHMQKAFEYVLTSKELYQIKNHSYKVDTYPLLDRSGEVEYIVQSSEERTNLAQQRDFDLFNFSPVPMWAYDTHTLQILAANNAAQKDYGYTLAEFLRLTVTQLWPEEDIPIMMEMIEQKVKQGLHNKGVVRHIKKNGTIIHIKLESKPVPSWGENTRIAIALDITSTKILNDLESHEKKVLELNSKSEVRLTEVLTYYVKGIESLFPQMRCTIMQVKHNRIYSWVPSSLPTVYTDEIEGLKIGVNAGSCGTAAFLKETVIVTDINLDPRWVDYRKLALSCNLFACWSQPIVNSTGEVMATFAIYYNQIKTPNEDELKVIERASSLLKVVLENRQYAETLNENNLLMTQTQELAHFGNWSWDIPNDVVRWSDSLYSIYGLNKEEVKITLDTYLELLHPEDRVFVKERIRQVLNTHEDVEFEERIIRTDGEVRYLKSWVKLKRENGRPVKIIGATQDITERINYIHTMEQHNLRLQDIAWAQTHLVRAPLARILGIVELLENADVRTADKQLLDYLSMSAKELDKVIKDIIAKSLT